MSSKIDLLELGRICFKQARLAKSRALSTTLRRMAKGISVAPLSSIRAPAVSSITR
jgi:hypothetical protein